MLGNGNLNEIKPTIIKIGKTRSSTLSNELLSVIITEIMLHLEQLFTEFSQIDTIHQSKVLSHSTKI